MLLEGGLGNGFISPFPPTWGKGEQAEALQPSVPRSLYPSFSSSLFTHSVFPREPLGGAGTQQVMCRGWVGGDADTDEGSWGPAPSSCSSITPAHCSCPRQLQEGLSRMGFCTGSFFKSKSGKGTFSSPFYSTLSVVRYH